MSSSWSSCSVLCLAVLASGCFSDPPAPATGEGNTDDSDATGDGDGDGDATGDGDGDPTGDGDGDPTGDGDGDPTGDGDGDPTGDGDGESACAPGECPEGEYCIDGSCEAPPAEMVAIPAGTFWMGCNEDVDVDCWPDEYPYHEVTMSAYAIDRTEVTVADYAACMEGGECGPPVDLDGYDNPCQHTMGDDQPVVCVTWFNARDYCQWAGKELATEAQWEKAARGDDGRLYPWGNQPPTCNLVVMSGMCGDTIEPVGSKPAGASPYGVLDMAGNVFEWTADWYSSAYYLQSPDMDPPGPDMGTRRTVRSAAPNYVASGLRISQRGVDYEETGPDSGSSIVGFRCALVP